MQPTSRTQVLPILSLICISSSNNSLKIVKLYLELSFHCFISVLTKFISKVNVATDSWDWEVVTSYNF